MKTTILKRSPASLGVRLVLMLFLIDTAYALLIMLFLALAPSAEYFRYFVLFLWALHTAKYILITILLLRTTLEWIGTSYVIEGQQLVADNGVYARNERLYDISKIKKINVHQDWLGRLLRFGNITLELSSSGYNETLELHDVRHPADYQRLLAPGAL